MYIALDNERVTRNVPVFEDLRRVQAGPDGPGVDYTPPGNDKRSSELELLYCSDKAFSVFL